jgi:predicted lipoprotein with Yx(FWY)xxD motif
MKRRRAPLLMIAVVALAAIGLVACGGSSNSSDSASAAANTTAGDTGSGSTVSTKSISGVGTVLVDSSGQALYTNNRDSGMNIACTGECTSIWTPVMAPSSGSPTSSDQAVQSKLGVVKTNGGSQVTFGGKPLYSFAQDSSGQVTGDGVTDSFGGTSFTWTVASTGTASAAAGTSGSTGSSGSSSSSGYGSSSGSSGSGGGYGY